MLQNNLLQMTSAMNYEEILDSYRSAEPAMVAEAAEVLRERGNYRLAAVLYYYLLGLGALSDYAYGLGESYGKMYRYEEALPYLEQAFASESTRVVGANYYAYILERNQQLKKAAQWYEKALDSGYKSDLWTLSHYAHFLEKCGDTTAAEQAYEDVLTRNPAYTWALKRYAMFLVKQNQAERSLALMRSSLHVHKGNPFVKLNYLEYLILQERDSEYDEFFTFLGHERMNTAFQVLVELFDYCKRYLARGKRDSQIVAVYEQKTQTLKETIHRDFDDLSAYLATRNGDLGEWHRLIDLLIK